MNLEQTNSNHNKKRKLLFISAIKNKSPVTSCSALTSATISQREKLLKNRQFHLEKIKNQIQQIIQAQIKLYSNRHNFSSDFSKCDLNNKIFEPNTDQTHNFNSRFRSKRRSLFKERSIQFYSDQSNTSIQDLSSNLVAMSKQLSIKQKQRLSAMIKSKKTPEKVQKINSLPMIISAEKTFTRFNRYQPKLQPWKFRNEDYEIQF